MFPILAEDEAFLAHSIGDGQAIIILGAGASFSSRNKKGEPVKQGAALAETLAKAAGLPYAGEPLPTVLGAVRGQFLSDVRIKSIYKQEYSEIQPADDLTGLSRFTWRRLYTWSIDDAINNSLKRRVQRSQYFNGMTDSVAESTNLTVLQVVKLHGDILHPEHGFIMSEAEYATTLASGGHAWYRKAASDYISYTPIFIGSRLSEPIFSAEIERAKRIAGDATGRGYVITPDTLSPIEQSALKARGLIHVKARLSDFVQWLDSKFPRGLSPKDVIANTHDFSIEELASTISADEIDIINSVYPRKMDQLYSRSNSMTSADLSKEARRFLRGFPPTWDIAASEVPVWLTPTDTVSELMQKSFREHDRLFLVVGQAGSGKSTAIMQSLIRYGRAELKTPIYELAGEVKSVKSALSLLQRMYDEHVVVFIANLFIFGDQLADDLRSFPRGRITVVSTARQSEWNERLARRLGDVATYCEFSRFTRNDYQPLIDRLITYVPAPAFRELMPEDRVKRLARSNEQLLIALREATDSENFNDIITNEWEQLPDNDCRMLLLIIGLATIARVGIEPGAAKEAYSRVKKIRSYEDAEHALEGIVSRLANGRIFARHELYVRHIVDNVTSIAAIIDSLIALCENFTKFKTPVVRNVNRVEATLFRFAWNHKFIYEQCKKRSTLHEGERLYASFEISFQLDGHFWLQYGLYLSECDRLDDALVMLKRSIQAYPNNPFAVHALAELLFRAAGRTKYETIVGQNMIDEAVRLLEELDARQNEEIDQYPLVTLSNNHVGYLVKTGEIESAQSFSRVYYERLRKMEKKIATPRVVDAKERMFKYFTVGEWDVKRPEDVKDTDLRHKSPRRVRNRSRKLPRSRPSSQ